MIRSSDSRRLEQYYQLACFGHGHGTHPRGRVALLLRCLTPTLYVAERVDRRDNTVELHAMRGTEPMPPFRNRKRRIISRSGMHHRALSVQSHACRGLAGRPESTHGVCVGRRLMWPTQRGSSCASSRPRCMPRALDRQLRDGGYYASPPGHFSHRRQLTGGELTTRGDVSVLTI